MKENDGIMSTHNYGKFIIRNWNRSIKKSNLKRIDKSVQKDGWLKHPIMVNEKMEIIDGQHRYIYAKEHNLPVYYIIVPGLDDTDCVTMNNARISWTLTDYVKYYAEKGSQDYILLQGLLDKYAFMSPSGIADIVQGSVRSGGVNTKLKSGNFTLSYSDYQRAVKKLDFLSSCSAAILNAPGRPSALFAAVAFTYDCPGIDRKKLQKQIQNNMSIITPPANNEMAFKELEYLYNYRMPKDKYVYIYNEYRKQSAERQRKSIVSYNSKRGENND